MILKSLLESHHGFGQFLPRIWKTEGFKSKNRSLKYLRSSQINMSIWTLRSCGGVSTLVEMLCSLEFSLAGFFQYINSGWVSSFLYFKVQRQRAIANYHFLEPNSKHSILSLPPIFDYFKSTRTHFLLMILKVNLTHIISSCTFNSAIVFSFNSRAKYLLGT